MHGLTVRTIGMARATEHIFLKCLTYNMYRYEQFLCVYEIAVADSVGELAAKLVKGLMCAVARRLDLQRPNLGTS